MILVWFDVWIWLGLLFGGIAGIASQRIDKKDVSIFSMCVSGIVVFFVSYFLIPTFALGFYPLLFLTYFLFPRIWNRIIEYEIKKRGSSLTSTEEITQPEKATARQTKIIEYLTQEYGYDFKPFHVRVIHAMSKGRTKVQDIAKFVSSSDREVKEAIIFFKDKRMPIGLFTKNREPNAKRIIKNALSKDNNSEPGLFTEIDVPIGKDLESIEEIFKSKKKKKDE